MKVRQPLVPLVLSLLVIFHFSLQASQVFPYNYQIETLENGLKVVSIPLKNPDIISYYTIVRSGSRNEIEPGKSGFAHFFEHMMFKGTKNMPREAYDNFLTKLGAGTNGYTTDDYTCYFVVFAGREHLEEVVRVEADRFINLYFDEEMLKTEAPVIEGEYYSSVSNPNRRLYELLRHTAYEKHSYKHTTLGYLEDIKNMPNQFAYSQLYKKRFYAPDNTILLVVGDFDHDELMTYVRKYYSPWPKSGYKLVTPTEPPQKKQKRAHYEWPTKTLPRLAIAFHGPAYSDTQIDKAALDLLAEVYFSRRSSLFQRLVIDQQICLSLSASFPDRRDPYLLIFNAVLKDEKDLPEVEKAIFEELTKAKNELVPTDLLRDIKSNLKYSFLRSMETTDGVAGTLAFYINLTTDPGTVNQLFDLYDKITPENIQEMAKKYFRTENSTVATLTGGKGK
ncbi:MAG: insulinase family protein [Candidatus Aminicenantes bacterium]|nr:MAG: insulinase family protein [Candidatus Aminicenantes bacterium]HDJ22403.1 insulinase family protein [Candidatus Aminicenantes bacterium]